MPSISSPGVGSGLDVTGIINGLMNVERRPLQLLQTEATKITTKVSAWGKIQSQLAALQDSARNLMKADTYSAAKASSSDESKVKVTTQAGATAGNYDIEVTKLAQRQSLVATSVASDATVVGSGSLTFTFGTVTAGSFSASATATPISVAIPAGSTLAQVRDAINAGSAGVNASIITDANGARLAIRGNDSGDNKAFEITATDNDGTNNDAAGLSQLAYSFASAGSMTKPQTASNAALTIDGIAISSASNTITGAINAVTIQLIAPTATATPAAISVASDGDAIKQNLQDFVDAYNSVNKTLADQVKYDATTKRGGPLQGDRGATQIQAQLRELLRSTVTGGSVARLSDIGIEAQRDGSLKINSTKLGAAIAVPGNIDAFFRNSGQVVASDTGIARKLDTKISDLLGTAGTVTGATSTLSKRSRVNQEQQEAMTRRLDLVQKNLQRTYTALDQQITLIRSTPIPGATG